MQSEEQILKDVQANILAANKKDFQKFFFIEFFQHISQKEIINWVRMLPITTAYEQPNCNLVVNLYFANSGFRRITSLSEIRNVMTDQDKYSQFLQGMDDNRVKKLLFDSMKESDYEKKYWKPKFDALLVVSTNDVRHFSLNINLAQIEKVGSIIHREFGEKLYNKDNEGNNIKSEPIEPFGFRDGITRVKFFDNGNLIKSQLPIVLDDINGSYLVFRKLEQSIKQFDFQVNEFVKALKKEYKKESQPIPSDEELRNFVEGQIMGRFKDGTPITICENPAQKDNFKDEIAKFDSFDFRLEQKTFNGRGYKHDSGNKCPINAHIRKINPREDDKLLKEGNKNPNLIVRRSIPYEENGKAGLLFMCFQRDINQFVEIQQQWCNDVNYSLNPTLDQVDKVAGQSLDNEPFHKQKLNLKWGAEETINCEFSKFVHFRGGQFFYAPSISFIESLYDIQNI